MKTNFFPFGQFFGNNSHSSNKKNKTKRTLRIEELEGRDLLSVSPFGNDHDGDLHTFGNGFYESGIVYQPVPMATPIAMAASEPIAANADVTSAPFEAKLFAPGAIASTGVTTLYLEYTNTDSTEMKAPILVLQAKYGGADGAKMTLDPYLAQNASTTAFSSSIQIYADGAKAGTLQAGETVWIPVYWAGWNGTLPNNAQIDFSLQVLAADSTELLDAGLKTALKSPSTSNEAWDVVWNRLQLGNTWGDYVSMLGDVAKALEQTGSSKETTYSAEELFAVAIQWANDAYNPFGTLVTATDLAVAGPMSTFQFTRTFIGTEILSRYYEGDLGYGWDHNWNIKLNIGANSVAMQGSFGSERLFQKSGTSFVASLGDKGILTFSGSTYTLTEADGTVLRFNASGELLDITDPNKNKITATHTSGKLTKLADAFGNWMSIAYGTSGKITSVSGSDGNTMTYTYDASGKNLIKVTNKHTQSVSYAYAAQTTGPLAHTLTTITYADGNKQHFAYDAAGVLVSSNIDGMPVTEVKASGLMKYEIYEGTTLVQTIWLNSDGQIVQAENPAGQKAIYEYDHLGRVVKITDEANKSSTLEYDSKGNMTRVVNAAGQSLQFTYTAQGTIQSFTDANGKKTTFRYDARGNLVGTDRVDGTFGRVTYYDNGQVHTVVNRRGESYTYKYDSITGRLVENKPSTASNAILYQYDARGNLTKITDGSQITTMTYNDRDLVTRVDYSGDKWIAYTYDNFGRQTEVKAGTITSGVDHCDYHVAYTYTSLGLLHKIIDKVNGDKVVTEYQYDAQGRPTKEIQGNGTYTTYTYNDLGSLLTKTDYDASATILSQFVYTYNSKGTIATMDTLDGKWTYTYDTIGQLTKAVFASTNVAVVANQSLEYFYDSMGNRTKTIENGTTITYTVNAMNQYTQIGDITYKYDADGNMTEKRDTSTGERWTFTWCQGNWMRSSIKYDASDKQVEKWEYEYDAFGNRIAVVHTDVVTNAVTRTEYLIDLSGLGNVLTEYDANGNRVVSYFHGYGLTSQIDASNQAAYYGFDVLGSTSIITDASGQVVNRYTYDPFGKTLSSNEGIDTPFQFVGQYGVRTGQHAELLDMRARWYDPNTGRFISEDPIDLAGGANLYAYTQNNPVNSIDPTGEVRWCGLMFSLGKLGLSAVQADIGSANLFNPITFLLGSTLYMDGIYGMVGNWQNVKENWNDRKSQDIGSIYDELVDTGQYDSVAINAFNGTLATLLAGEKFSFIKSPLSWAASALATHEKDICPFFDSEPTYNFEELRKRLLKAATDHGTPVQEDPMPSVTIGGDGSYISGAIKIGGYWYSANDWLKAKVAGLLDTTKSSPSTVGKGSHWAAKGTITVEGKQYSVYFIDSIGIGSSYTHPTGMLDLSGLEFLSSVSISNTNVTSLNVSGCTNLTSLSVNNNAQLTSLNVSGCTNLKGLTVTDKAQLTSLNVSGCTNLTSLTVSNNTQLTSLDVFGCTNLTSLSCSRNQLTSLDVSSCKALESLSVSNDDQLTLLNVSNLKNLKRLNVINNTQLTSLNVSGCTNLKDLEVCYNTQLTSLDVSGCTALEKISAYYNAQLTSLDVSGCTNLEDLSVYGTQLTSLDVSDCTNLTRLSCNDNQLTSLDVSGCTNLVRLYCPYNQLTSLDVSSCTNLERLECNDNRLTSLDVSNLKNLERLYCHDNRLTSLIVENSTALAWLDASYNILTSPPSITGTKLDRPEFNGNPMYNIFIFGAYVSYSYYDGVLYGHPLPDGTVRIEGKFSSAIDLNEFVILYRIQGSTAWTTQQLQFVKEDKYKMYGLSTVTEWRTFAYTTGWIPGLEYEYEVRLGSESGVLFGSGSVRPNGVPYAPQSDQTWLDNFLAATGLDASVADWTNGKITGLNLASAGLTGSLDVSTLTALTKLDCSGNNLTALNVSGCSALKSLDCQNNPLLTTVHANQNLQNGIVQKDAGTQIIYTAEVVKPGIVTDSSKIDKKAVAVSGMKLDNKSSKPTQTTLTFLWTPPKSAKSAELLNASAVTFDLLAPKQKGETKAKCLATVSIDLADVSGLTVGGPALVRTSGGYTFSITLKATTMYMGYDIPTLEVKISGLAAGTKYTVEMQAKYGNKYSKVTKVSASTAKYNAVTNAKLKQEVLGQVTFGWKDSTAKGTPKADSYDVGFWIGTTAIFSREDLNFDAKGNITSLKYPTGGKQPNAKALAAATAIWAEIGGRIGDSGLTTADTKVTFDGVTQKITFAVRAVATDAGTAVKSAVAKIAVTPLKYPAPATLTQGVGTKTFTWEAPKLKNVTLPDVASGADISYTIGVYDSRQKMFTGTAAANTLEEDIPLATLTSTEGALAGVAAKDKVAVMQVIKFTNGNVVKSAVKVVTVK